MRVLICVIKYLIIFFFNIVLAIAGNKDDLYENEEVDENEAKQLASELNAIFQKTSAKDSKGIEDLFTKIGEKFLNPKSDNKPSGPNARNNGKKPDDNNKNIKLSGKNGGKQKGKCC